MNDEEFENLRKRLEEASVAIVPPKKGELWDSVLRPKTARVMADPIEGYVMARFKGAFPFLVHTSDWHRKFVRNPQ